MERKERRRLVQTTLFPQSGSKKSQNCVSQGKDIVIVEEDLNVSSEKCSKSRRTWNQKQETAPTLCSKEVLSNEVASSIIQSVNGGSPVVSDSSPCGKASGQLKEHKDELADSPDANGTCTQKISRPSSSASRKEKRNSTPWKKKENSTPTKESRNSTPNKRVKCCKSGSGVIPFDLSTDVQLSQAIPDLRLEAKLAAEETSRISAGRKTHPFFTFWKGAKQRQDITISETSERKERSLTFHPIHVLQNSQDEDETLDWGRWGFSECSIGGIECARSKVLKEDVGSLKFNSLLNGSKSFDQISTLQEFNTQFHKHSDFQDSDASLLCMSKKVLYSERERNSRDIFSETTESFQVSCDGSVGPQFQDKVLMERITCHDHATRCQPANSLWTDKYRPNNAKQICGNDDSVESISWWLQQWYKKETSSDQVSRDDDDYVINDLDCNYQHSDSDDGDIEDGLKNVLLVTGRVGSGKSAAIYACARDQGFRIIEINASDWRNGALIKQKFGEATESHCLQRTEKAVNLYNFSPPKSIDGIYVGTRCSDKEVTEQTPSHEEVSQDSSWHLLAASAGNTAAVNQTKAMILFEDVDASLSEDRGFITTVQQLAATAKRPIILTSNSENPVLPNNLDRSHVRFSVPSVEELLGLAHAICAAEKTNAHPFFVERCVRHCQGDIRKTILLLQFWWQGLTLEMGKKLRSTYSPVSFDVDAGHDVLPSVLPHGYPSQLSDIVADEVDKSLNMTVETCYLTQTEDGLYNSTLEKSHAQGNKPDCGLLRKEDWLDGVERENFNMNVDLNGSSCSPIAFSKRRKRRKFILVLSSDSEEDGPSNFDAEILYKEDGTTSGCILSEVRQIPTEQLSLAEEDKLEEYFLQLPEKPGVSHLDDPSKSQGMPQLTSSDVPEAEIVQEAKLYSTTLSYSPSVGDAELSNIVFSGQNPYPVHEPTSDAQIMTSPMLHKNQRTLESNSGADSEVLFEENIQNPSSQSVTDSLMELEYQPLEERSHMDFARRCKSLDSCEANGPSDHVKETWKRLYGQRPNLRSYVTAEERGICQVLKLAHGLSSLISEADLLFRGCQGLASDSIESSLISTEKTCDYGYDHLEMSSVVAEHGICFYAKEVVSSGSSAESTGALDLASEMLSRSRSSIALGKLASLDRMKADSLGMKSSIKSSNIPTSKPDTGLLCNVLRTSLPAKSYPSAKGYAFHDYVSTLSQISRFESHRLSDCLNSRKQRRSRVSRHYLCTGSFSLSAEDISVLGGFHNYKPKALESLQ